MCEYISVMLACILNKILKKYSVHFFAHMNIDKYNIKCIKN